MHYKICSLLLFIIHTYRPIPSSSFITCRHQLLRFIWPSFCYIFCGNIYVVNSRTSIYQYLFPRKIWSFASWSPLKCDAGGRSLRNVGVGLPNYMASRFRIPYCWYRLENLHTSSMQFVHKSCASVACMSEDSNSNDSGKTSVSFSNNV